MNSSSKPNVLIVDDDDSLAQGLSEYFHEAGLHCRLFTSGEDFIGSYESEGRLREFPVCILLDVRMKGISGIEVFYWLKSHYADEPYSIIFLTGHGDIAIAVQMVKRGAFDFVQKPFDSNALLKQVELALEKAALKNKIFALQKSLKEKLNLLTSKEKLVMKHVLNGDANKDIAERIGNSVRTVELHRASIFHKMEVKNAIELARVVEQAELLNFDHL